MHPNEDMNNITLSSRQLYINNEPIGNITTFETFTSEDRCVCCGEIIPEGRMVCPMCENQPIEKWDSSRECTFTCELNKKTWYKLIGLKWYQVLWIKFKSILNKYFRWCKK